MEFCAAGPWSKTLSTEWIDLLHPIEYHDYQESNSHINVFLISQTHLDLFVNRSTMFKSSTLQEFCAQHRKGISEIHWNPQEGERSCRNF